MSARVCAHCGIPTYAACCPGCGLRFSIATVSSDEPRLPSRAAEAVALESASESPEAPAPAWGAPDPGEADVAAEVTASVSAGLATVKRASLWTTPTAPGAGGLPASKIPGLEDEIRVLTLDDVAEPPSPLTCRCGAPVLFSQRNKGATICARCERREAGTMQPADYYHDLEDRVNAQARRLVALEELAIGTRLERLEHPEPVGPVAPPIGDHVECSKERKAVVAFLRRWGHHTAADRIEDGTHLAKATP